MQIQLWHCTLRERPMNIKKEVRQHLIFSAVRNNLLPPNTLLALLHETDKNLDLTIIADFC